MIKSLSALLFAPLLGFCAPAPSAEQAPPPPAVVGVAECVPLAPVVQTVNCDDWDDLYRCLQATVTEVQTLNWIRQRESGCGWRLVNPGSSDIGDCQLNGAAHGVPGWSFGQYWPNGWAVDRIGLRPGTDRETWRSNASYDNPEGITRLAAACLMLLRGVDDGHLGVPDAFKGCKAWKVHKQIRKGFGCGVAHLD